MGQLLYGSPGTGIDFDDRVLAHLQLVITAKLRREEKFTLSWQGGDGGRNAVWIHPAIALQFIYTASAEPKLNHPWIEALMVTANSNSGLRVVAEPVEAIPAVRA
ncbi:MAG: ATP-dependent ligase [Glaciihabitans sp.]|nr:ATP-dependent ligase [Glaciihabitans sp.]